MAESKSSGTCQKLALSLLALWFIGSLITIVVWATAPDFKSAAQCRAELRDLTVQHEGSKVVCQKNQEALEQMVTQAREEQERLTIQILELNDKLNATNHTLEQSRMENLILMTNISALQETVETLEQIQANLTTQLDLKDDHIEALELNLTQAEHQTQSCFSLKDAAEAQTKAAESQTRACQSNQNYLQKQLQKCKESNAAQQTTAQKTSADSPESGAKGSGPTGILVLALLLPATAHLLT
ncbi:hypothetical protein NQD34_002792 [Periophthalmus magnuspinnatus]|uniref:uncharacterized protein si:ch211-1a19.3 n=1 Tax=Periophthalmus magnuspinnatus TaxID=409849 RepID=UPI00145B19A5|nr:uncharacterized protein si:ch211-1a19.3 [Periophthalmus magnuspinnatus]KAJ0032711.1 hypothetical protein NQD34_002792 [Periophthalmus magnuspinnatus]